MASSRVADAPPLGPGGGRPQPDHPAPTLSVGLHAVDAPNYLAGLDHVVIVRGSAAKGRGSWFIPRATILSRSASAILEFPGCGLNRGHGA